MTIALSPLTENAVHDPNARPALIGVPATVTFRSLRGMENLKAPSDWTLPLLPSASSTGFHSGGVCGDCATAAQEKSPIRTLLMIQRGNVRNSAMTASST